MRLRDFRKVDWMKKRIVGLILVGVLVLGLTGCESDYTRVQESTNFDVMAMKDTGVLYYRGTYIMTPYISENGKFCKLVDGKIVEIDDEKEVKNNGNGNGNGKI